MENDEKKPKGPAPSDARRVEEAGRGRERRGLCRKPRGPVNRAFADEESAAEFTKAWMAAAAEATGDDWRIDDRPDGVALLQEFRSAKGNPDPSVVRGAVYCVTPSRRSLADFLFFCAKDGLWPLRYMKECGSPEEATLRFAARGAVP